MQIFFLDHNPIAAARALCDTHVVKMPVESLQLLAAAHHRLGWQPPLASQSRSGLLHGVHGPLRQRARRTG